MGGVNLWRKLRLVSIMFDQRDPGLPALHLA